MADTTMKGALKDDFKDCAGRENDPYSIKIRDVNDPSNVLGVLCFNSKEALCTHLRENHPPYNNGYYDLSQKDLSGGNLEGAHLVYADLSYTSLNKANLKNADMLGATLVQTNLRLADMEGAETGAAVTDGADFSGSNFSQEQFSVVLGWPSRMANGALPKGHPDEGKQKKKTFGLF